MRVRIGPVTGAADALCFTLDAADQEPLAQTRLTVGSMTATLRLLGLAHQVTAGPITETVAALPGRPGPLPYRLSRDVGGWRHTFTADVYRRGAADFDHATGFLTGYLADRGDALLGLHEPGAVSAIMIRPIRRGLDWRAWHTFPGTRQIVATRSRMIVD